MHIHAYLKGTHTHQMHCHAFTHCVIDKWFFANQWKESTSLSSTHIYSCTWYFILDLGQATYFSAVCVSSTGLPKLQLQINKADLNATTVENQLQMIIDGSETDIALIEQDSNTTQEINGVSSNLLFKRTNSSVTVLFSTGISLTVASNNVCEC